MNKTDIPLPLTSKNAFRVPATLIWGERDTFNPPWVAEDIRRRLEEKGAKVRLKFVENAGHFVQEESPELTAEYILDHLSIF